MDLMNGLEQIVDDAAANGWCLRQMDVYQDARQGDMVRMNIVRCDERTEGNRSSLMDGFGVLNQEIASAEGAEVEVDSWNMDDMSLMIGYNGYAIEAEPNKPIRYKCHYRGVFDPAEFMTVMKRAFELGDEIQVTARIFNPAV